MNVLAQAARPPDPTAMIAAMSGFVLLFGLIVFLITVAAYYVILKKTGYNPWLSLLILLPGIGSLILLLMLVFTEWPIEREVKELRARLVMGGPGGIPPTGGAIVYPNA